MKNLIGREAEIKVLQEALASNSAELVALYGRRRVGKTHLIRTVYQKELTTHIFSAIKNKKIGFYHHAHLVWR